MLALRQVVRPSRLQPLAAAVASAGPALTGAGPLIGRSYAASASSSPPSSASPRRRVRSLAEIEADKMDLRGQASGARWVPTKEPGEDAQMTVFERPPSTPIWAVLLFTVSMTACFTAASLSMTDLLDKEVVSEKGPPADGVLLADGSRQPAVDPEAASIFSGALGYLPSRLPSISNTWAYFCGAAAVGIPLVVLFIARRTGARVIKYRPSGRLRIYSRLDDRLGKGKLVDFAIAEGLAAKDATPNKPQLVMLHLPPLGFDPTKKQAKVKLPTINLDMRPLSEDDLSRAKAAGRNVVVDHSLLGQAFGGISTKVKQKVN